MLLSSRFVVLGQTFYEVIDYNCTCPIQPEPNINYSYMSHGAPRGYRPLNHSTRRSDSSRQLLVAQSIGVQRKLYMLAVPRVSEPNLKQNGTPWGLIPRYRRHIRK